MTPVVPRGNKNLGDRVKILLADDSVTMHRAVKLALKNEPYEVITCDNGQDALRLCLEHHPQIVLADLDMPLMTGPEVAAAIKKNSSLRGVKVVLLCGSFDQVDESKLGSVPTDGRIWKPFEAHTLVAMLKTLLQQQGTPSASSDVRESSSPTGALHEKSTIPVTKASPATARASSSARSPQEMTSPTLEKGLMEETFQEAEKGSEVRAAEPTLPAQQPRVSESPTSSEPYFQSASETEAKENLWTDDYKFEEAKKDQPFNLSSKSLSEGTQWDIPAGVDAPTEASDQFEIVTSNLNIESPELPTSDLYSAAGNPPAEQSQVSNPPQLFQEDEWVRDRDFTDYQSGAGIQEHQLDESPFRGAKADQKEKLGQLSSEEIKKIVHEELQSSMRDVLKEILQEELSKVLAEIERD